MKRKTNFLICFLTTAVTLIDLNPIAATRAFADDHANLRIAIIGAGPAGLTAALTLSDLGYKKVTVFEAEDHVGGKTTSISIGNKIYDTGAVMILPDAHTIFELAQRFSVPYRDSGMRHVVRTEADETVDLNQDPLKKFDLLPLLEAEIGYKFYRSLQPTSNNVDFAHAPSELNVDFATFSKLKNFEPLAISAAPLMVGCGYGFAEQIPALYLMQLLNSLVPLMHGSTTADDLLHTPLPNYTAMFTYGYQSLWTEIARHLDVKLNSNVTQVTRSKSPSGEELIKISTSDATRDFDRVIIATPLDKALQFLDASPTERDLLPRIQYIPYTVTLFKAHGLQSPEFTFFEAQTRETSIGHVTAFYNRYSDGQIWTSGQISSWATSRDSLTATLRQDINDLGGTVDDILMQKTWPHFPHVTKQDLDDGFYSRLNGLQGTQGTYYVGGVMNFDTVEETAKFARDLMRTKF